MATRRPRNATVAALAALSMAGLAGCGRHHHVAAPPPPPTTAAATPTSSASSSTSSSTVARHHRHHHRVPAAVTLAPLTGLPTTAAAARRPAVIVKIDNVEAALPQTGPDQADVVYEEMVEGGLTRLAAVFQSQQPTSVGPVRSGRLTDEGIADDLDHPVLTYEGANALFLPQLAAQPITNIDADIAPDLFIRDGDRTPPHNTYTDIAGLTALDTSRNPPPALWAFRRAGSPMRGAGVRAASGVAVTFPAASVQWSWDAAVHLWLRTQDGVADTDSSGARLSASNIVVQFVPYITSAYVTGEGAGADGAPIPEGEMVGSGTAWFLSDGAIVEGTWTRASLTSTTRYRDRAGTAIALQPGRTWVELARVGTTPTVTP